MHSRIFELSTSPIHRKERITSYGIPEWFCGSIADYVDDISESEREGELTWFVSRFGEHCSRAGDKISFGEKVKESYFAAKYRTFISSLSAALCTLKDFSGASEDTNLPMVMFRLQESYEDRYSFYVYDHDIEELLTLDSWVRRTDLSKSYYLGGVIDYHF